MKPFKMFCIYVRVYVIPYELFVHNIRVIFNMYIIFRIRGFAAVIVFEICSCGCRPGDQKLTMSLSKCFVTVWKPVENYSDGKKKKKNMNPNNTR